MDASTGINAQDAGLFSFDAYNDDAPLNLGGDWVEDAADEKDSTGAQINEIKDDSGSVIDQFRIFTSNSLGEVVFAFKGSDNWSNLRSDLMNSGLADWKNIAADASVALCQPHVVRRRVLSILSKLGRPR